MLYPLILLIMPAVLTAETPAVSTMHEESIQDLENKVGALEDVVLGLVAKIEQQEANIKSVDKALRDIEARSSKIAGDVETFRKAEKRLNTKPGESPNPLAGKDVGILYSSMTGLVATKNYASAEKIANDIVTMKPKKGLLSMVYFWLGEIRMIYGDHKVAKDYYEKALALQKNHEKAPDISLKLAVIAYENGRTKEADGMIEDLLRRFPKSTASHLARLQKKKYHAPRR